MICCVTLPAERVAIVPVVIIHLQLTKLAQCGIITLGERSPQRVWARNETAFLFSFISHYLLA